MGQHTHSRRRRLALATGGLAVLALAAGTMPATAADLVTTNEIANGAVTTAKIRNGAVTNDKLRDGAVGTNKLAPGAVTNGKLRNGAVGNSKLQFGSVGTGKIQNGAVTTEKLAPTAVAPAAGQLTEIRYVSYSDSVTNTTYNHTAVDCPSGYRVVGGGGYSSSSSWVTLDSYPSGSTGWRVEFVHRDGVASSQTGTAYAICLKAQNVITGRMATPGPRG